jgi:integrase
MNRKRKSHKGLPHRVYVKHGAYYFVSVDPIKVGGELKKWIRLCAVDDGQAAMLSALAKLLGDKSMDAGSMPHLCTEYAARKLGKYSKETQDNYRQYLSVISAVFDDFGVADVTTKDWSDFLRAKYPDKANTARKVTALGKRLFKYGISELGLRSDNPLDQIDLDDYEVKRRTVIPTHEQVAAIRKEGLTGKDGRLTHSGPMLECLIDMAYLCWQRAGDIRTLEESSIILNNGSLIGGRIPFKPGKTKATSGLAVEITITPAIADVIERARAFKRKHGVISKYVFAITKRGKSQGKAYTKSGLFSMWDRARERAKIADDIWFKDLRALAATDALKAGGTKSEAQKRLVHTTDKTTDIYIKEVIAAVSSLDVTPTWLKKAV